MKRILVSSIVLGWTCSKCSVYSEQPLEDIVTVGTAICPNCGDDMELEEKVKVNESFGVSHYLTLDEINEGFQGFREAIERRRIRDLKEGL